MTMASTKANKEAPEKCKRIRTWLRTALSRRFGPDTDFLQGHIASCPRCQRRLARYGRVNLAMSVLKSQPHKLDLLMRANEQAIGVLKHSLRHAPKAQRLKTVLPEPKPLERWWGRYAHSAANAAACVAILFLMKVGVFSSMDRFHIQGQRVIRQYYTSQVGEDLANELFVKDV